MLPEFINFEGYRAFKDPVEMEIKPITVIIGKNNSGKSSILKLIEILGEALKGLSDSPLPMHLVSAENSRNKDDLFSNKSPHGRMTIGIGSQSKAIKAEIQNLSWADIPVVARWSLTGSDSKSQLELEWVEAKGESPAWTDANTKNNYGTTFRGLIPFVEASPQVSDLAFNTAYIGPLRAAAPRVVSTPHDVKPKMEPDGGNWISILEALRNEYGGKVVDDLNDLMAEVMDGAKIALHPLGEDVFIPKLRIDDAADLEVALADTGAGIGRSVPLYVAVLNSILDQHTETLHLVEQPELHLHPAVQGALANLYVNLIKNTRDKVIIETHSENFLLRLRTLIARQVIDSEQVAVYFVDKFGGKSHDGKSVRDIKMKPDGSFSYWPEGVFEEDFQEMKALLAAQRKISAR